MVMDLEHFQKLVLHILNFQVYFKVIFKLFKNAEFQVTVSVAKKFGD